MGSNNSVRISSKVLRKSFLGTVQVGDEELDLYYEPKQHLFTTEKGAAERDFGESLPCKQIYDYHSFLTVCDEPEGDENLLNFKYLVSVPL